MSKNSKAITFTVRGVEAREESLTPSYCFTKAAETLNGMMQNSQQSAELAREWRMLGIDLFTYFDGHDG